MYVWSVSRWRPTSLSVSGSGSVSESKSRANMWGGLAVGRAWRTQKAAAAEPGENASRSKALSGDFPFPFHYSHSLTQRKHSP